MRGPRDHANRSRLLTLQLTACVGTLGFWSLSLTSVAWTYYALYVWSGIITSLIVVRFWLLLADLFTITEGKRLFAGIAMGGSVGALRGGDDRVEIEGDSCIVLRVVAGPGDKRVDDSRGGSARIYDAGGHVEVVAGSGTRVDRRP